MTVREKLAGGVHCTVCLPILSKFLLKCKCDFPVNNLFQTKLEVQMYTIKVSPQENQSLHLLYNIYVHKSLQLIEVGVKVPNPQRQQFALHSMPISTNLLYSALNKKNFQAAESLLFTNFHYSQFSVLIFLAKVAC